jgi:hypothetical protein
MEMDSKPSAISRRRNPATLLRMCSVVALLCSAKPLPMQVLLRCIPPDPVRSAGPVSYIRIDRQARAEEILKGVDLGPPKVVFPDVFFKDNIDAAAEMVRVERKQAKSEPLPEPLPPGILVCLYDNGDLLLGGRGRFWRYFIKDGKSTALDIYDQWKALRIPDETGGPFDVTCVPGVALILRGDVSRTAEVGSRWYAYDLKTGTLKFIRAFGPEEWNCYMQPFSPSLDRLALCRSTWTKEGIVHTVLASVHLGSWTIRAEMPDYKYLPTFSREGRWAVARPIKGGEDYGPVQRTGEWTSPPTSRFRLIDLKEWKNYDFSIPKNLLRHCTAGASVF